jgi:hypothetical protein
MLNNKKLKKKTKKKEKEKKHSASNHDFFPHFCGVVTLAPIHRSI